MRSAATGSSLLVVPSLPRPLAAHCVFPLSPSLPSTSPFSPSLSLSPYPSSTPVIPPLLLVLDTHCNL